ncbi:polyprenyl synthetase family protein [Thermogladius sp. KZ2Tp1]|uniref:polyprenyl synthetase family protein n=1 Tax=Thermogladius sp. KZ2Tp1 TaxID=3136289 RepID=UPI003DA85B14
MASDPVSIAKSVVEQELSQLFGEVEAAAKHTSPRLSQLAWIIRDFTLRGGKRFRATLVLAGFWSRRWGRELDDDVRKVMASVELLQSYLLVHDDIMDRDEIRRGGPTAHAWFRDVCVKEGLLADCPHYGVSQGITAGDLLESLAVRLLSSTSPDVARPLISRYTDGLMKVAFGQYLDVLLASLPLELVSEQDVITVHTLKTASYTVELPLHLGAIASRESSTKLLNELSKYAIPAGVAFQLRDDIIGLFGKTEVTGKPVGSDVVQKKKTLLVVKAYEFAGESAREKLREIYSTGKQPSVDGVNFVVRTVEGTGALDYTLRVIDRYVAEANRAIDEMTETSREAREFLRELLLKMAYREV